jgi:hypothetical protein
MKSPLQIVGMVLAFVGLAVLTWMGWAIFSISDSPLRGGFAEASAIAALAGAGAIAGLWIALSARRLQP